MSTTETLTLWYIEFRSFSSWDYHTPLIYIPEQRTNVRAETAEKAQQEVMSWASPGGYIQILCCERAAEWLQKFGGERA